MKYCLITGASSGIGYEFAHQLKDKYIPILVARREDRLNTLKEELGKGIVIVKDLSKKEEIESLFEMIKEYDIELFINNAGFGLCGEFEEVSLDRELQMIDINIKALHIMLKYELAYLNNKDGKILNVASIAGILPAGPYMSTYYASKQYVRSLTEGVSYELKKKKSKVKLYALCPGPVDSEFNEVANASFSLKGISANKCVKYTLKKLNKKKVLIIPSLMMRASALLSKVCPKKLAIYIAANGQSKKINK